MCDYTFDECIDLCTEDIFEEITLEDAMRTIRSPFSELSSRVMKHIMDAWVYQEPIFTKFKDLPKSGLVGPHTIRFRRYSQAGPSTKPAIEGRVPTVWMLDNHHRISEEDFYNHDLTEEDLKRKYGRT